MFGRLDLSLGARRRRGGIAVFTETATAFFAGDTAVQPFIGAVSYPSGIHVAALGKSFLTWERVTPTTRSVARVRSFDHAAGTPKDAWSPIYDAGAWLFADDAHGQPVLEHGPDGHFYCFFAAHNTDIQWAISDSANDISVWNQQTAISGAYAYPKPVTVGSDIHLLARKRIASSPLQAILVHRKGTPSSGALAWGSETQLVDFGSDSRCYVSEVHRVGTDLHFIATKADGADTAREHVYCFIYETATGDVTNFAGDSTIVNADLPVDLTEANAYFRIVDSGTNRTFLPSFQIDTNGNEHILYGDGTGTSIPAKHIWHNGTAWQSAASVATIQDGDDVTGFVDVCALVPAASGAMEAIYPQDPNSGFAVRGGDMTRKVWTSGGGWGSAETLDAAGTYARAHPFAFRDCHADMRAAWCEVRQADSYTSPVALKLMAHGDRGFALPADPAVFQYPIGDDLIRLQVDDAGVINDVTWQYVPSFSVTSATVSGTEIVFDGTDDRINWPDSGAWTLSDNFTMRFDGVKFASLTDVRTLIGHQNAAGSDLGWRVAYASGSLLFQANFGAGLVTVISYSWTPTLNQAYDIAFEREGTTLRLYIDDMTAGNSVASATMSSDPLDVAHPLVVGAEHNTDISGNYRRFFSGRMTKVRLVHAAEISG